MVQELFVTKNSIMDKTGLFQFMFEDVFGESFVFQPGNENWKMKRKACAHAFYKDRLEIMMNVLKEKVTNMTTEWHD